MSRVPSHGNAPNQHQFDLLGGVSHIPSSGPLQAYLACALMGLEEQERQLVFQLSDVVAVVCASLKIDLYEPRKKTDPVHNADVSSDIVFHLDRRKVLNSDLVIYLAQFPSTGAGEELDFAFTSLLPIVVVTTRTARVSRMVKGTPNVRLVEYDEPEELRLNLYVELNKIRPALKRRRLAIADHDGYTVAKNIRRIRCMRGLSVDQLATRISRRFAVPSGVVQRWEDLSDRESNLSLLQLREIAYALNVDVSQLVTQNAANDADLPYGQSMIVAE